MAEAASGEWGKVDLLLRIEGDDAYAPAADKIRVEVDGLALPADRLVADADGISYRVADLAADGGLLSVDIVQSDTLPLDNRAQLRLPDRQPIRVQLSDSLPTVMAAVLGADSAIELVNNNPDVVVRRKGEALGGGVAALEFIDAELQSQAFVLGYPEQQNTQNAEALLGKAVQRIGLGNIDTTGLAQFTQRPVEVAMQPDRQWTFSVWQELLSDDYNFVQSRSFPLFVAHSVRWLAGVEKWYPYLAASRPLPATFTGAEPYFVANNGKLIDTLGADFIPRRSGELRRVGADDPLAVSLLDYDTTTAQGDNALQGSGLGAFELGVERNSLVWLLLLALIGLLVEWWLYQRGRMP